MFTCILSILTITGSTCQAWEADDKMVASAIHAGRNALLEQIDFHDEIEYRQAGEPSKTVVIRGTVKRSRASYIEIDTVGGIGLRIPRRSIIRWTTPGHVKQEMHGHFFGGPSALAAFALVSADVKTTHPALALMIDAMTKDNVDRSGTYVRSLRASVWSALLDRPISRSNRLKYRKLLRDDMAFLNKAMRSGGGYSYTRAQGNDWDNSNTQFANLGLWAGSVGGIEVSNRTWLTIAEHWRKTQQPAGGWAYSFRGRFATGSMTVAGCNSLYIVLDRYYPRADAPYRYFEGIKPRKTIRKQMKAIYEAIEQGDKYLALHRPNISNYYGYELFGLERLGLASGRAVIGGRDWFRQYASQVARHNWGNQVIADAFALIFLVHGQAPILIQKLEHGEEIDDWNYYQRDIHSLTRYMTRTFERLYRWQRIPPTSDLRDFQDAPILYISGTGELDLPGETLERIRRYTERGGTVFLHADRANGKFTRSATAIFERLYRDLDYRFKPLDESHPVYTCHFDCRPKKPRRRHVPFRAIADGPRIHVLLCPVDIAGAWHQARTARYANLFEIMANLRVYVASPYGRLPKRLRADPLAGPDASSLGRLALKRLPHAGNWNAHPGAWQRYTEGLQHRTGIRLVARADAEPPTVDGLIDYDVVHLTTRKMRRLTDETLTAVRAYIQGGGLLLIDAADGRPAGIDAACELFDTIDVGVKSVLLADHPITTGAFAGGRPLTGLETTKAGSSLTRGGAPPPILTRTIDGRIAVLACPFDVIAAVDGHFVWNRSGYRPEATAKIVDNILAWRLAQLIEKEQAALEVRDNGTPRESH